MVMIFRDEQGFDLSAAQIDGNFRHLVAIYDALVADPPTAVGISNITVTGSQFTVWLSDGSSFGPFTLPIATFHWRGEWLPSVGYFQMDIVTNLKNVYLVLQNHTSDTTFDPDIENSDEPIYHLLWGAQEREYSIPVVLNVTTYIPQQSESGSFFHCTHPDGCVVTIKPYGDVGFWQPGDEMHFYQQSDNPIEFVADPGVTFLPVEGYIFATGGRGRAVVFKYINSDTWAVVGGLALDPGS